jgi:hypothetical protein
LVSEQQQRRLGIGQEGTATTSSFKGQEATATSADEEKRSEH